MSEPAYLEISRLYKAFSGPVLRGIDLGVRRGELLALLGPSGCGKTTLLRILAGLLAADAGSLRLEGQALDPLPSHRRDIGVVFQNYALFPHMTVRGNVGFGLEMRGVATAEARARVDAALQLVQLQTFAGRRPHQLSGGQQQRVALARAVVIRPRLLLLDEPLSNLDAMLRAQMRGEIRDLHVRTNLTTVLVTHDQTEALTMSDRVAVMSDGQIAQVATPEQLYRDPATAFVAAFVGSPPATLLRVAALSDDVWQVGPHSWRPQPALAAAMRATSRRDLLICLRPERLRIEPADYPGAVPGKLVAVEFLGADRLIHVAIGEQRAIVRSDPEAPPPSAALGVVLPDDPPLFETAGGQRIRCGKCSGIAPVDPPRVGVRS
jgi:ABC-type Fe3+/spermidine/putrescine transport system ATPase subunit